MSFQEMKELAYKGNSNKSKNSNSVITKKVRKSRHQDVVLYDDKVCTWNIDKSSRNKIYTEVSNYSTVKEINENIDTEEMRAVLTVDDGYDIKDITVELGEIASKNKIMNLLEKGLDVNEINAKALIKHLRNQREFAPKTYSYSNLGFRYYYDDLYYNHYKTLAANKENDVESTYDGELLIKPKGSGRVWLDMVKSSVIGNVELELALVIGFSAALVGYLGNDLGMESPLIHIYSDSSKGKTTAAMLAISAFGSPNQTEKGLFMTWNATGNAMHESMGGNVGVPILFDESSMCTIKDLTSIIYSLTSGKNKLRLSKNCKIKDPKVWRTTIISTGENSLTSKSSEYTGIRARLFEFGNITWTKDAAHSDLIKRTVIANYGHCGSIFARYLMRCGKDKVRDLYDKCAERLKKDIPQSQLKDRIAGKFALITATAEIMKKLMKIDLNISGIEKMLIDNEIELADDKDIEVKALGVLMEKIAQNKSKFGSYYKFSKGLSDPAQDKETWGVVEYTGLSKKDSMQIVIIASVLEKILMDNGFNEPKVVIKKWKERGILDCEVGKTYRKRNISGIPDTKCYVIKINKGDKQIIENKQSIQPVINSSKKEETTGTDIVQELILQVKESVISPFWDGDITKKKRRKKAVKAVRKGSSSLGHHQWKELRVATKVILGDRCSLRTKGKRIHPHKFSEQKVSKRTSRGSSLPCNEQHKDLKHTTKKIHRGRYSIQTKGKHRKI
jgi:putative DNA primase/helicase